MNIEIVGLITDANFHVAKTIAEVKWFLYICLGFFFPSV